MTMEAEGPELSAGLQVPGAALDVAFLKVGGSWIELLNSDATDYGGSGVGNLGAAQAEPVPWRDRSHPVHVTVPPLACLFFRRDPAS